MPTQITYRSLNARAEQNKKTKINTMTANSKYKAIRKDIDKQIAQLQKHLKKMDANQAKEQKNWGFVGNAEYISSEISSINNFAETK